MVEKFDSLVGYKVTRRNMLRGFALGFGALATSCSDKKNTFEISSVVEKNLRFSFEDEARQLALSGFEQELLANTNQERIFRGLKPLFLEAILVEVARLRSWDMATRDYFAHSDGRGGSAFSILGQVGYPYMICGENICRNNYPDEKSEKEAFEGLMGSENHRTQILSEEFTRTGVGHYKRRDGMHYFTQLFAKRID